MIPCVSHKTILISLYICVIMVIEKTTKCLEILNSKIMTRNPLLKKKKRKKEMVLCQPLNRCDICPCRFIRNSNSITKFFSLNAYEFLAALEIK